MEQDSLTTDTVPVRPLPEWLVKQKQGLNTWQPEKIVMKEDKSLQISFVVTGLFILLVIGVLTIYFARKKKQSNP